VTLWHCSEQHPKTRGARRTGRCTRPPGRGRMSPGLKAHAQHAATGVTDRLSARSVRLRILRRTPPISTSNGPAATAAQKDMDTQGVRRDTEFANWGGTDESERWDNGYIK